MVIIPSAIVTVNLRQYILSIGSNVGRCDLNAATKGVSCWSDLSSSNLR